MIYGDPFKFALQFDEVEVWSNDGVWRNGLFAMYINGVKIFAPVDVVELRTTFDFYKKLPLDGVIRTGATISAVEVFKNADDYFTGEGDTLLDGIASLTCTAMGDSGCYVYLMKVHDGDRLVWSLDNGLSVVEEMVSKDVISELIAGMPVALPA